jgi:hypothetical protein
MSSVDLAVIEEMHTRGAWDEAGQWLSQEANWVESVGAECIALRTDTMHKVADAITGATSVPMLNVIDVTADAIRPHGIETWMRRRVLRVLSEMTERASSADDCARAAPQARGVAFHGHHPHHRPP